MNAEYFQNVPHCLTMMDKGRTPWEEKKPLAYWVGSGTGNMIEGGG